MRIYKLILNHDNLELIDTLWNVNTIRTMTRYMSILVQLIDTLWNVNNVIAASFASAISELIDTLWNVNAFSFLCVLVR